MKLQITVDSKLYEVDVEIPEDRNSQYMSGYIPPYSPASRVTVPPVVSPAPASETPAAESTPPTADGKVCRSPMAGVVVQINAQVGQQIQENDLLMVLEAMKMETNITAPVAGKVKTITVNPGDAVAKDQVVVEFE